MKTLQHDTSVMANSLLISTFGIKMTSKYTFDITDQKWFLAWFVVHGAFNGHLEGGVQFRKPRLGSRTVVTSPIQFVFDK